MAAEETMLAITCDKCRRRFTPTTEELRGYLALGQGRKYTLVTCPHCGKGNKVAAQRVEQALRFSPAAESPAVEPGSGEEGR
jgi:RNase P subunit RPR2